MSHDAKRTPGSGGRYERHAIGVTRMCLNSGSVQLPYALSGALPEGELLVHDESSDEPLVLWSEPPRRLAGLAPFFERHEVHVNDRLVLALDGDDLRLTVAKRPRRSRPAVTPSTWHSLRDDPPAMIATDPVPTAASTDDEEPQVAADGDAGAPEPEEPGTPPPDEEEPANTGPMPPENDMPRAPRVKVKPLRAVETRTRPLNQHEHERPSGPGSQRRRGAFGGLLRAARSWFGRPLASSRSGNAHAAADESKGGSDWTAAWDEPATIADDPVVMAPQRSAPVETPLFASEPSAPTHDLPTPTEPDDAPIPAGPDAHEPASRTEAVDAAWTGEAKLPAGVPIRAERFLGGDLRTRLLRFLASPDMPLIAKSDMVAKRFDLDGETAAELLADIADDPPPGLRLTPVREGAWRIERSLEKG